MANTFRKVYKKTGNSGSASDYQLVGNIGVGGVELDLMKGATSSVDGELGLVPKPTKGQENFVLTGGGTFDSIGNILNNANYNKHVHRDGTGCEVRFDDHWVVIFINARVPSGTATTSYLQTIILPEYTVSDSDAVTMNIPVLSTSWRPYNSVVRLSFSDNIRNANIVLPMESSSQTQATIHLAGSYLFPRSWFRIDEGIPGTVM